MFRRKIRSSPLQKSKPKPVSKPSGTFRVKASLLSLESRLMFDAAAAATAAEVQSEQVAQEQAEAVVSNDHTPVAESQASVESQELLQAIASYLPGEMPTEVAFVDPTVPDYQSLIAGMGPHVHIVMLDGGQDGVEQIAASLAGRTGIDAIHIISHGAEGQLSLGTGTLSLESMSGQYAAELAMMKQSLSESADILVYGCEFAEGQAGQEAAMLLSQLTGADVAASTDATGFAALGGDWVLETQIGTIETQVAVDDSIQASWVGLLAAPVADLNAGGGGNNVTTAFTEQTSVLIAPAGTLSDVDSANLNRLTVRLTARPNGNTVESLSLNAAATTVASGAGLTVSYTASTGVLLISGTASTATYQTILQGILYNNTSDQPTTSNRSITVVARDSTNASSTSRTATITVTAVNDAPTIASLSGDSLAYSEGDGAVVIEQSGNALVTDVDSTNLDTGTLTVSIPAGGDSAEDVLSIRNQGTGAGQIGVSGSTVTYGGLTIGTFTGGSSGSNLVITFNASATPTAVTALVRNITYQNTDTNAPTTGARTVRFVLTDGDGGTIPNYDTTVTVSAVNDAPVLADTVLTLTVTEDAGIPSGAVGSLVSAFTGGISDVDSGAAKGIAITGSNQTNGIWYYTRNGGTTWTAVGTVSNTSALLLADNASTRLYFAPNANYNGTSSAALTVRAWDQTSGTAGSKVSTASNGGTTAFSSATDTVDVTVTAVNDAPTIASLSGDSLAYSEGDGAVVIEQSGNALVTDVDSTNLDTGTLTVSIPAGGDSAEDVLSIRNQGTGAGQIGVSGSTVTYGGTTIGTFTGGSGGTNLVITFNSNATPTAVTRLVRNITYQNTDTDAPTTGARTVRFVLTDGDGGTSPNYDTTVTVTAVNDAPVLTDTILSLTVAEDAGTPSGAVGSLISAFTGGITDVDSGALKGIAITGSNQTNGTWYYTTDGGSTWTAVGTVSNTSALLLADNASTRLYFAPNANYNGTSAAALTLRAWDQSSGTAGTKVSTASNGGTRAFSSATDTVDVTVTAVNDAPTGVPLITGTVTEDQILTADTSGIVDADSLGAFSYQWLRDGVAISGATGGTYTLGDADVGTQISVTVSYIDGEGNSESLTSAQTVPVLNVNDVPLLVTNSGSFVDEGGTDTIDAGELAVADVDNSAVQLTYTIGAGPAHGRLELITAPGISTSSFTQADILANRLIYVHDGSETTSDSFAFTVSDGAGGMLGTTTMTLTITPVNDTPTITSDGGASMAGVTVAEHVSAVTIVTGADVDLPAQPLTYHISGGVDQAWFTINMTTGALSFIAPPNFEVATDANGDNVYVVQVQVIDSQGARTTQTIQVTVTDVPEAILPTSTTPLIPPVLLPTTALSPTAPGLVSSPPSSPVESSTDTLLQFSLPQGPGTTPVEPHFTTAGQLSEDSRTTQSDARISDDRGKPMDLVKGQPLFTVLPVNPAPTQRLELSETQQSVNELSPATLDEMVVSLESPARESDERHPLITRIVALTGTTLSVAFVAWALHCGAVLAGIKTIRSAGGTRRRDR